MKGKKRSKKTIAWHQIGWREHVALPEFGIPSMRAKIDTGARTSALHATDQFAFEKDGEKWVSFLLSVPGTTKKKRCTAPLVDRRNIKNTGGTPEQRFIIEAIVVLGNHHWHIEVSLADREKMEYDMILGRTAIKGRRLLVNPGKSFLLQEPLKVVGKDMARKSAIRVK